VSETGQPAQKLRTGLQALASWMRFRRAGNGERGDDLLADPVPDSVEFTSLSPVPNSRQPGRLFAILSDAWIRRHSDPFLYECADSLVTRKSVVLVSSRNDRLTGKVCDGEVYSVEIWFENGGLSGSCQCESCRRNTDLSTRSYQQLACAHIVALANFVIDSGLVPLSSVSDQADLCPITRLPLDADRVIYRCERCQLSFSEEGWQFLKEMDRGRCCGCQGLNCIHALKVDTKDPLDVAIS
jgi:hypothetical protein